MYSPVISASSTESKVETTSSSEVKTNCILTYALLYTTGWNHSDTTHRTGDLTMSRNFNKTQHLQRPNKDILLCLRKKRNAPLRRRLFCTRVHDTNIDSSFRRRGDDTVVLRLERETTRLARALSASRLKIVEIGSSKYTERNKETLAILKKDT